MLTQSEISASLFLGNPMDEALRFRIKDFFNQTFDRYASLFACLNSDHSYYQSPESLRHPLIFYFGHTAVFYINKLVVSKVIDVRVNEHFESLFAVGVDEMSWDDLNPDSYDWPSVDSVRQYRQSVQNIVNQVIDDLPLGSRVDWQHPAWIILMGIEHELIHLETSSVLIRQLDLQYINSNVSGWEYCLETNQSNLENEFVPISGQSIRLGLEKPSHYYAWDNEYGIHQKDVESFCVSKYLISNAEFLKFMRAGGYQNDQWWSAEGLAWRQFKQAEHPIFWVADSSDSSGYRLRNMLEDIPLPLDWPVEVNYYEAKAYCQWFSEVRGIDVRLPTEEEWHCLYEQCQVHAKADGNISLNHYASSCPVTKFQYGSVYDVIGNVWQWTETPIRPFQGFEVHSSYDDFSIPTFDDQHFIIKGGSWISCGNCARRESRYSFRKHFYQHAGFRLVYSEQQPVVTAPYPAEPYSYETEAKSSMYLEAHYGEDYLGLKKFSVAIVDYASQFWCDRPTHRALDLGCSVGRSCFELSRYFDHVVGLDFSTQFIRYALQLQETGRLEYTIKVEGDIQERKQISIADLGLAQSGQNVSFFQADACNLARKYSGYDLILAANILDRLYNPGAFLQDICHRINPAGLLVLTSPYTWIEEYTERSHWLGGPRQDGSAYLAQDHLKDILLDEFELLDDTAVLPMVLRETQRKYEYIQPGITVWAKK